LRDTLGAGLILTVIIGSAGTLVGLATLILVAVRHVNRTWKRRSDHEGTVS
jgi:hypothetical protein